MSACPNCGRPKRQGFRCGHCGHSSIRMKRRGRGDYYCGSFEFVKDPLSGDMPGGWGYTSWLLYIHPSEDPEGGADFIGYTLGELRSYVELGPASLARRAP